MILKEYQKRTLVTVGRFMRELATWRAEDQEGAAAQPELGFRLG